MRRKVAAPAAAAATTDPSRCAGRLHNEIHMPTKADISALVGIITQAARREFCRTGRRAAAPGRRRKARTGGGLCPARQGTARPLQLISHAARHSPDFPLCLDAQPLTQGMQHIPAVKVHDGPRRAQLFFTAVRVSLLPQRPASRSRSARRVARRARACWLRRFSSSVSIISGGISVGRPLLSRATKVR